MNLCATYGPHNTFGARAGMLIELWQAGPDNFAVFYGASERRNLNYAEAASELGACIMHHEACNGELDNRSKTEARRDVATGRSYAK